MAAEPGLQRFNSTELHTFVLQQNAGVTTAIATSMTLLEHVSAAVLDEQQG